MRKTNQRLVFIYGLVGIISLNISIALSFIAKTNYSGFNSSYLDLVPVYNLIWLILFLAYDSQWVQRRVSYAAHLKKRSISTGIFLGAVVMYLFITKSHVYSRLVVFTSLLFYYLLQVAVGYYLDVLLKWYRLKGRNNRKTIIIGESEHTLEIGGALKEKAFLGYEVVGYIADRELKNNHKKIARLGSIKDLKHILEVNYSDLIIIANGYSSDKIEQIIDIADYYGIRVRMSPPFQNILGSKFSFTTIEDLTFFNLREIPLDDFANSLIKRVFDIVFSLSVLLLLLPIIIFLIFLVIIDIKGVPIYMVKRLGRDGREFTCYKLRSMYKNDDPNLGKLSTQVNDPRISKTGRILRKYNLDELPQFWNVLKGDMSVVGPRPHRKWLNQQMQGEVEKYMTRHYLRPGITGWAQVNGWRGLTDTYEKKLRRTEHDLWYMHNWSFWLDIKIIFLTVFGLKVKKNAY